MCDWLGLSFALGLSFCSAGRFDSGCTPEKTDGVYLGMAKNVQLALEPGKQYQILVDARSPRVASSFSLHGARFENNISQTRDSLETSFDPWSASAFVVSGTFTAENSNVVVTLPSASRHDRERVAVCPLDSNLHDDRMPWWKSVALLSTERTKMKLFSGTLVYPPLPIPIGALVLAYLKRNLSYQLLLVILFYTDGIWWLTNFLSSSELSGLPSDGYLPLLFCVSGFVFSGLFFRTNLHRNLIALYAIGIVSLITSPFYYTPLALVVAPVWLNSDVPRWQNPKSTPAVERRLSAASSKT